MSARFPGERHFRNGGTRTRNFFQQFDVFWRIDAVVTAGKHGDGAGGEAGAMGRCIDAACQTRHDGKTRAAEVARDAFGKFHTGGGSVARADYGNRGPHQRIEFAAHSDDWRRIRDHLQSRRIFGVAEGEEFNSGCTCGLQFSFGLFAGENSR